MFCIIHSKVIIIFVVKIMIRAFIKKIIFIMHVSVIKDG